MKIILIQTPIIIPKHHASSHRAIPPISLAYINAHLINSGFDSQIIDAPGEAPDQYINFNKNRLLINGLDIDQIIKKIPPDTQIIGVSCQHSNEWIYDSLIIKEVKNHFPQATLVLGGEHATATFRDILAKLPEVDYIILGEGEETFVEIAKNLSTNSPLGAISGVAFRGGHGEIVSSRRKRLLDLSKIPLPNWKGVPLSNYLDRHFAISSFYKRTMPLLASRGCPYSCDFCTCKNMWSSKWVARPVQNVIDEIESYISSYAVEHIDFVDMTLIIDSKWAQEFCEKLISKKWNLTFSIPIGTHPESLSLPLLELLKEAGLEKIVFSTETGSSLTLEKINKTLNLNKVDNLIKKSLALKINTKLVMIFGFPGQNAKEVGQSYYYITKFAIWGGHDLVCLAFVPYPGTVFYEKLKMTPQFENKYNPLMLNNDFYQMKSWSNDIPDRFMPIITILGMAWFYSLQFTLRPWRFILLIKRIFIIKKPFTALESILYCRIQRFKHL